MSQDITKHNPDSLNLTNLSSGDERLLILHNDDVNTFAFVIDSLIEVCGHDPVQAEQCAFITHHQGECDIKRGEVATIKPMQQGLLNRGLLVTIE